MFVLFKDWCDCARGYGLYMDSRSLIITLASAF